jgi:hypothetical protein
MTEYTFDLEQFPAIRKRALTRIVPFMALIFIVLICSILFDDFNPNRDMEGLLLTIIVIIAIYGIITYRAIKRIKTNCEKYKLVIEDNCLITTRLGSNFKIPFTDISRISESKSGTICIIGKRSTDAIAVSPFLKNHEELRSILYNIKSFENTRSDIFWQKFGFAIILVPAIIMLIVLISENKLLVGVGGLIVLSMLGWYIFTVLSINTSKSKLLKKSLWMILLLLSVLLKMYFTFF